LENNVPVISSDELSKCNLLSNREWLNFIEPLQGSIVTCPGKRPSSIRLDQLDRDNLDNNKPYPLIIHFSMYRNTWLPIIKNNLKLKKLYHKYFKLRHLMNNKSKPSEEDKSKLRTMENQIQQLINKSSEVKKEMMIELSSENFFRTGIRTDVVQQTILIPTLVEHIRFHVSLKFLEKKINYNFKNRLLLQYALTHPSGAFLLHQNLGSNPDHIRNVLFNCKVRNPNYGCLTSQKRKNLLRKKGIHTLFSIMAQKANHFEQTSMVSNYERLEFLGDKILELLTSKHLFALFPSYDEGQLSEYRNAIVQNQYLAVLARKLDLQYFILFYHGVDLCSNSALNHALANSFEALLAAIYLDSDLETVADTLSRTLWSDQDEDLLPVWNQCPPHPIQSQLPEGDRHLISNIKVLQHVNKFEEMIGVEFKHIRLLAQAFSTRSASFNLITLGDNQRLEFLGDTVLNFLVSEYLYRYFPNHHEGHLSLLRSSLVCNSTQALLYDELGMSDFVINSFINNRAEHANGNLKRKADVFEAFIGALFLDQGLDAVRVFCNVCMFNKLQDIILYQFWNDPKSRLQQCCLSLRDVDESKPSLPTYKLVEEKGPPNNKQYRVAVYFNRKRLGEGIGKSIHDAEVEAAKNALKKNANMFPILNKYIADEFKMSKYFLSSSVKLDNENRTKQKDENSNDEKGSTATSLIKKKKRKAKRRNNNQAVKIIESK
jgi:ribonuclease-3